ncbi:hypothetical protein H9P43_004986 [Blastocladiella emersonii ATCC 22665]|nr:hypothetical protein H9P43_004986 [Blastocladiella emersonii ATCC 22665]
MKRSQHSNDGQRGDKRVRKNDLGYRLANQPTRAPSQPLPYKSSSAASAPPGQSPLVNAGGKPRHYTVSMAVPGSIIDNCQSLELKTYVAGQIARAAAIYNVDEIIVYNESPTPMKPDPLKDPNVFLARLLLYQECPQYLRKEFFPVHPSLRFAGLLNPLDAPHHVRADERSTFRDGVVLAKKPPGGSPGCLANVGLRKEVYLPDKTLTAGVRVTVRMQYDREMPAGPMSGFQVGEVVSRRTPREEAGVYWGYTVRLAEGLHNVFNQAPGGSPYDTKIGTSERGLTVAQVVAQLDAERQARREDDEDDDEDVAAPNPLGIFGHKFHRALVVFGGVKGVEAALDADEQLDVAAEDAHQLFDHWLNTCPGQGSRTIRTEEAVLVSLAVLSPHLVGSDSPASSSSK